MSRVFGGLKYISEKRPVPSHAKVGVILWRLRYYNDCCKFYVKRNIIAGMLEVKRAGESKLSIDTIGGMYIATVLPQCS